jgi:peptidoglycan-associated lipoprotein
MNQAQKRTLIAVAAVTLLTVGCAKKKVTTAPPPAPAAPAASSPAPRSTAPARSTTASTPSAPTTRSPYPNAATRGRIDQLLGRIEDAYFDYNKSSLRSDALSALQKDSSELRDILKDYPNYKLTIEGHCDERGSAEYNLALGNKRADAAKDYLVQVGIPASQFTVVSYGKERPVCEEHDENCWQRNRRVHFVATAQVR